MIFTVIASGRSSHFIRLSLCMPFRHLCFQLFFLFFCIFQEQVKFLWSQYMGILT